MSRLQSIFVLAPVFFALLTPAALGQVPFTIELRQNDTIGNINPGDTITLPAPAIGMAAEATLVLTYTGDIGSNITGIALAGSTGFSVQASNPPFPIDPEQSFTVRVQYLPAASDLTEGTLTVTYQGDPNEVSFTVNLNGTAPEFAYSYTPAGGNASQLAPGDPVEFPDTAIDATSTAAVVVTNVGTAPGDISGVSATGTAYVATGLPLFPTAVAPGNSLNFTLAFTPDALGAAAGRLALQLVNGPASFPLTGLGTGAQFTYEIINDGQVTPVQPGQAIRIDDTLVNETSSVTLRVRNTGNSEGVINTITLNGDAFSVSDLPFLPATLQPDGTLLFALTFAPVEVGQLAGRLKVGADEFDLIGEGVGAFLEYSSTVGGITTPLTSGGTVAFPPAAIGASTSAVFTIANSGTTDATIATISLGKTGSPFTIAELPSLPLTLAGGASTSFTIEFRPVVEGSDSTGLVTDAATFTLSGTGTPPPPLPGYVFEGDGGVQEPASQPSTGLRLGEPYPMKVVGTLQLAFASEAFADDPAVQFATGGRKVSFEIPAGDTMAVFPNGTDRIKLQTGTIAGTITLTPTFATEGGADLTPDGPVTQTLSVLESAPAVTSVVISDKRQASITISVTGFATSRAISEIGLNFSSRSGENVSTTSLTIPARPQFAAWYASAQPNQFGSQFSVTVPLSFSGDTNNVVGASDTVASITVTLTNAKGTSDSMTVQNPE